MTTREIPTKQLHGPFGTRCTIDLAGAVGGDAVVTRMPWCHRVLLENEIDLDPSALAPRAEVTVVLRRSETKEIVAGESIALLDTAQDVALIRAAGMIPMILRRALEGR